MIEAKKLPEDFVAYGDNGATITLAKPLDVSGVKTTALLMREPTVADQLAGDASGGSDANREVNTFANLCDLTPADIKRLTLRDYRRVQAAYTGFVV